MNYNVCCRIVLWNTPIVTLHFVESCLNYSGNFRIVSWFESKLRWRIVPTYRPCNFCSQSFVLHSHGNLMLVHTYMTLGLLPHFFGSSRYPLAMHCVLCSACTLYSAAVRNDIRQRDDDISADVLDDGSLPRHAQEHQGVHETAPSSSLTQRTSHGLRHLKLGSDKRHRYGKCRPTVGAV